MKSKITQITVGAILVISLLGFMAAKGSSTKSKVGHINTNELWNAMPEKKAADEQLKKMQGEMVAYLEKEQKTLEQGIVTYQKDSANMSGLVKNETVQKLLTQQKNLQSLPDKANEELKKKQNELYQPIRVKMQKAIDDVASENGYDYIMDVAFGNIVFVKNESDNILTKVKTKLNL